MTNLQIDFGLCNYPPVEGFSVFQRFVNDDGGMFVTFQKLCIKTLTLMEEDNILPTSQRVDKVVFFSLNVLKNVNDFSEKLRFKDITQSINRWRTHTSR